MRICLALLTVASVCIATACGPRVGLATDAKPGIATYDVVVYGDSSGAVTAAIQAKRLGKRVILINPTSFLGGMSSSGLGASDFGNRSIPYGENTQPTAKPFDRRTLSGVANSEGSYLSSMRPVRGEK